METLVTPDAARVKMTMFWLGGTRMPSTELAMVRQVAKSLSYPWSSIILISMGPRDAQSAEEEPEMPPKKKEATTLTMAAPPLNQPTSSFEKSIRVSVIPPALISSPIRMKKGTASSV